MSRSYIVIYPQNPLEPLPNKVYIIEALKHSGFLLETNTEWVNPTSNEIELFYTVGKNYPKYMEMSPINQTEDKLKQILLYFKCSEKIEAEFNASGDFELINSITGTNLSELWAQELSLFLDDNMHQWVDPSDGNAYRFFDLECKDIALSKQFFVIEDGWAEPKIELINLFEKITGLKHKWMWVKI